MKINFCFKRFVWVMASVIIGVLTVSAVPAHPRPVNVLQSDGTTLTVRLVGDEFYHRTMTTDGYTLLQTSNGDYVYALQSADSRLIPSNVIAHNPQARSAGELKMVSTLQKGLTDKVSIAQGQRIRTNRDKMMEPRRTDYQDFRGLLVLINYSDRQFTYGNDYFDAMMNQRNYTGYYSSNGYFVPCTGSARDYYYDNSMGLFDPEFDVVGPVPVNYTSTTPQGYNNVGDIFVSAIDAIDPYIDFSQYDGDGDGIVDMIYFVVAGYTANFSGNNSGYLWPHQFYMYYYTSDLYDGVYLGRYSCSGEIYGWEYYGYTDPDGIGTIVHEFTHALGIMDLYDTDYDENGAANDPDRWDVMSGGSYLNNSRTPSGFSIWERYRLGFADIEEISEIGTGYTLEPVNTSNTGYWMQTPNDNEFFLFENRQNTGWDAYLPGHGMLVTRVEFDQNKWNHNTINVDASHMYYELLRAGNEQGSNASDPFPGTYGVTVLNNLTMPSLLTWDGQANDLGLLNIDENNGIITFDVGYGDGTTPSHGFDVGDVNHDGTYSIKDVTALIDYLLDNNNWICTICADVKPDGVITVGDVTALIDMLLNESY
ncbi:MAG: M6 family metalloprotease domain-containing protein [Muribaculaceae bacterium]|nr:M6 family metalloprotease domain-containing protein [Muribaculaceae bacterium]